MIIICTEIHSQNAKKGIETIRKWEWKVLWPEKEILLIYYVAPTVC